MVQWLVDHHSYLGPDSSNSTLLMMFTQVDGIADVISMERVRSLRHQPT